jgi:hypothetical protein
MPDVAVPSQQAPVVSSAPPLVSVVVVPGRNGAYLREALDSIGSPDVPYERLIINSSSANGNGCGISRARNSGLATCNGEFVVFLSSEDKLAPGALELGAAQLEQHPEAAFVFGRCLGIEVDGTLAPAAEARPRIARNHYRELLRQNFISLTAMVMFRRTALIRAGGFAEMADAASEYDLYLRIARHYPVHDHGQVVAFYRSEDAHPANAPVLLRETLEVLRRQRPFLEADLASLSAYSEGWAMWQDQYGPRVIDEIRAGMKSHEWMVALRNTATLLRYHPRGLWHHARRLTRLPHRYGGRAMPA